MSQYPPTLPVLPLKNTVVYPDLVVPLAVGRPKSLAAVKAAGNSEQHLLTVAQRSGEVEAPSRDEVYDIGTLVTIKRVERREGGAQVIVQGVQRVRLLEAAAGDSHLEVRYMALPKLTIAEGDPDHDRTSALVRENQDLARRIAVLFDSENGAQVFQQLIGSISDPVIQMYRMASLANLDVAREQEVLEANTALELVQKLHEILTHELNVNQLRREIAEQAKTDIEKQQRDHLLRQQKRAIEQALGEQEGGEEEIAELKEQLAKAKLPEVVQKEADRELKRLARMSSNAADYQVARSYLELIAELPWHARTDDSLDLIHAKHVLDEDHFGLDDVKERILESLAVMQLNPGGQGADPVLRRAARRRQDVARPIDRARDGPQVRAPVAGRPARRSGTARPSPDVHRRDARPHHPGRPPGRCQQPGADARRNRQARPRLPRRSGGGAAGECSIRRRTTSSATTTWTCRSTCRRCSSSRRRTRSRAFRGRCSTAWR